MYTGGGSNLRNLEGGNFEFFRALEAQQRYFSYRAILVAMAAQNSFMLVFLGYRTIIARYIAKWGIAQMCLCEAKCQGGVSHHFRAVLTSLKSIARYAVLRIKFSPPPPTPEFLTKDFPSATRSRTEILTKENLVGAKTAPTAVSRTFTPLVRRIRFP